MDLNVSLPEELANFFDGKVATGRHGSSNEVVHEALRLTEKVDQQDAERLKALRQARQDGIDSGDAGELDFARLKMGARARHAADEAHASR